MSNGELVAIAVTSFSLAVYAIMLGAFYLGVRGGDRSKRAKPGDPVGTRQLSVTADRARPRVSILKPLSGADDEIEANLETFAYLKGVPYEILFGVSDASDPAYEIARRFVRRHPELSVRVLLTDAGAGLNPKVAQLLTLERFARGEIFVVSDSNVRVPADYLSSLVRQLERPGVGLVSSVLVGTGERTLGAALENLIVATHVTMGIAAGAFLSGRVITVGKSMAMYKADLAALGGFDRMRSVLAEDHALARIFCRAGYRVVLDKTRIENRNVECTMRRSFERHSRWAKIRRAMCPHGFPLEPILVPLIPAMVGLALVPTEITFALAMTALATQSIGSAVCLRVLRGAGLPLWLVPLEVVRTFVLLACWASAYASRRVSWRGHPLRIGAGTELSPIATSEQELLETARG